MNRYGIFERKTLQFLVPFSLFSFLISICYFITDSYTFDVQFSTTLIFTRALDRKYVFLIFNGILACVAKSFKYLSFTSNHHDHHELYDLVENNNAANEEDSAKQIPEFFTLHENEAAEEFNDLDASTIVVATHEDEHISMLEQNQAVETCPTELVENVEDREQQREDIDDDYDDDEFYDDDESVLVKEEVVSDVRVSTEELNQKFEEFIRRMKEEIRIEASRQQLIAV